MAGWKKLCSDFDEVSCCFVSASLFFPFLVGEADVVREVLRTPEGDVVEVRVAFDREGRDGAAVDFEEVLWQKDNKSMRECLNQLLYHFTNFNGLVSPESLSVAVWNSASSSDERTTNLRCLLAGRAAMAFQMKILGISLSAEFGIMGKRRSRHITVVEEAYLDCEVPPSTNNLLSDGEMGPDNELTAFG